MPMLRAEGTVIHVYRDQEFARARAKSFGLDDLGLSVLVILGVFAVDIATGGPSKGTAFVLAAVVAMLGLQRVLSYRAHYGRCSEIRLGDDGTCELETKRDVIRLHVNQIESVVYSPPSDETGDVYTIRYQGKSLAISPRMTNVRDFQTRLRALNPGVDVTFPDDTEPNASREGSALRGALFPLIVAGFVVWTAIQTLGGK